MDYFKNNRLLVLLFFFFLSSHWVLYSQEKDDYIVYRLPSNIESELNKIVGSIDHKIFARTWIDYNANSITWRFYNYDNLPVNYKEMLGNSNRVLLISSKYIPIYFNEDFFFSELINCNGCVQLLSGWGSDMVLTYELTASKKSPRIIYSSFTENSLDK